MKFDPNTFDALFRKNLRLLYQNQDANFTLFVTFEEFAAMVTLSYVGSVPAIQFKRVKFIFPDNIKKEISAVLSRTINQYRAEV